MSRLSVKEAPRERIPRGWACAYLVVGVTGPMGIAWIS